MNAAQLAEALGGKRSGSGWSAKCPAHDDNDPSLSINDGNNGHPVVRCHAGCEQAAVLDALRDRGLWQRERCADVPTAHIELGAYSKYWDYYDASGLHVVRVCRWDRGGKKEIRPLTLEDGRWQWKHLTKDRPLYRLRTLLPNGSKADRRALVVEGEKTADAAVKLFGSQFDVTTWSGGAKAASKTDWKPIAGRDVTLVPDNDEAGRKAMEEVAAILHELGCTVRVVDLAPLGTLPEGWDIADALDDREFDVEALEQAIKSADRRTCIENAAPDFLETPRTTLAQILAGEPIPTTWIYRGLFPIGAFLITGRPKIGKSWLLLQFSICAGTGDDFLGFEADGVCPGLYIAAEDTKARMQNRMRSIGAVPPDNVTVWTQEDFIGIAQKYSDTMTFYQFLERYLHEHPEVRWMLIDTEVTCLQFWEGERNSHNNERITSKDYKQTRGFDEIALRRKVLIGLVNHAGKGHGNSKIAGDLHEQINRTNTALAGASGQLVLANYPDTDPLDPSERKRLLAVRARDLDDDLTLVVEHEKCGTFKNCGPYFQVRQADSEQQVLEAIEELQAEAGEEWISVREVAEQATLTPNAVKKALGRMRKRNEFVWKQWRIETKKGKGGGVRLTPITT
jgi:hypothetical protein